LTSREAFALAIGVGKKVLVIEDSADVRELLMRLLGAHGFAVTGAATAAEGVVAALRTHPDLIILDLTLPDDDGLSVARTILSDAALAGVPIMAFSGYDTLELRADAIEAGFASYEVRPFDPRQLVRNVRLLTGCQF
jgi:two-component system OmpR family response regulator